jgi:hypothetical protein
MDGKCRSHAGRCSLVRRQLKPLFSLSVQHFYLPFCPVATSSELHAAGLLSKVNTPPFLLGCEGALTCQKKDSGADQRFRIRKPWACLRTMLGSGANRLLMAPCQGTVFTRPTRFLSSFKLQQRRPVGIPLSCCRPRQSSLTSTRTTSTSLRRSRSRNCRVGSTLWCRLQLHLKSC